jgi:hypothetical protein
MNDPHQKLIINYIRILHDMLTVAKFDKIFLAFYGTHKIIHNESVTHPYTEANNPILRRRKSTFSKIHITIVIPTNVPYSEMIFSNNFSDQNFVRITH